MFDKKIINDKYVMLFNNKTGLEIIQGINGNKDPFVLELPSLLDIGIMGTCQNKCDVCYQGHIDKPNMSLQNFKKIIDQVKHHVNQVALGGRGDPNNHENFKEILEYCRENNIIPNYTTSGINLTYDQIEISKLCGAVAISDYEQEYTYKVLQKFIDAGIKTNIHQIFSSKSFEKCLNIIKGYIPIMWNFDYEKFNAVIFLLFKPHGAGELHHNLVPTNDQLKEFAKYIFNPKSKFKIGMDSCLVNYMSKYGNPTSLQNISIDTCEGARMSAYISSDMIFTPCSFADQTLWGTSLNDTNLKDIWDNDNTFERFRNSLWKNPNSCPLNL